MSEIHRISAANDEDVAEILALLREGFAYMEGRIDPPSSLHKLDPESLKCKIEEEIVFVAMDESSLVGCVFARCHSSYLYLGKLVVSPEYQGQGISRLLIQHVEDTARELELAAVELETRIELIENQALFQHLGYEKVAENSHKGYNRPTSFCYRKSV